MNEETEATNNLHILHWVDGVGRTEMIIYVHGNELTVYKWSFMSSDVFLF